MPPNKQKGFIYKCSQCGKEYRRAQRAKSEKVYCSMECYGISQRQGTKKFCLNCGKEYRPQPSQNRSYCSWECYDQSRPKVTKICPICDREFTIRASNAPRYIACSQKCSKIRRRKLSDAERRLHQSARAAVNDAVRDGRLRSPSTLSCIDCGRQAVHYHHHKGYEKHFWLEVVPICHHCHHLKHT